LQITSSLAADGALEIRLDVAAVRPPGPDEVVVRIEAVPVNPSDLLTLLASVDPAEARYEGTAERPRVMARVSPGAVRAQASRVGAPELVGLEGAGVVVAAGDTARALVGKTVGVFTTAKGLFALYVPL